MAGDFDTIQSARDAHRSQLSGSGEQGAFVTDKKKMTDYTV